ncbi:xin actin-binding repeat-containing protein 1 isoform X1 [Ochotona princeps]|uniref:xin actin-binding repeat-containing protein 1 isoform X1 n=1 Tax=Ochotona princeps TaxID=9978 RepID=UPI0027149389|nr:xin actin-binding repeat-containing protein 1 isoform X1 [Ochotona princeps]
MADAQMHMAPAPVIPMATTQDLPLPPPPALEDLPLPPPKESFSKFHQQRQASELRRLYRHIHPELRKNLAEAVAEDLAEVLGSEEPTEGDVQCMRWIFENWRLDAIGEHERPAALEPVPGGDVQATSRRFEEGSVANSTDPEPAGAGPCGADVQAARRLFETTPLGELGQGAAPEAVAREPAASGDVRGTRMLFETRPLDRLGSRPSTQEQSPLELRSEIQELKGDVKKTVKLFQTEPLCAIQDAEGTIHEVKAACREEIQSNAVRTARWLFETRPLDAINRDPSQVRVIRGISLEEGDRPDVSAARWIFETQPLDAIREMVVDEKDFQPSPDLVPPGPDVQQQRHLFETRALDTLKGDEETGAEAPPKEEVVPGDVRSTLWLFETKPLDAPRDQVQVGHLQRVGPQWGEGLVPEHGSALPPSQSGPLREGVKGDVKTFKNLFETLPLDSIGQGEPVTPVSESRADTTNPAGHSQGPGSTVYAMQDSRGHLHALTSVSREQVFGGDVQGYRWMFETQPLDRLGRSPSTIDVVRGITRQEVVAGDVATARWLFETQPLELIHQREQQERQEEGKIQADAQPEPPQKGDVQTIRWLFETYPMSELAVKQSLEVPEATAKAEARSCTWMFKPQSLDKAEGSGEQHLQVSQVQAVERQTDRHIFETEPLPSSGRPGGRGPVRYCSRVEIPSGQVSRQKEVFQALEAGKREEQAARATAESVPPGSVHKFTWLFENCPIGSLAAESIRGGSLQEEQPGSPADNQMPERQETAAERTLRILHATPGILHHGGILMETREPGKLCLTKYALPGPGQGCPYVRKEELVLGELSRIVRQVLRRPDVDQQGLLVQEDPSGQLQLQALRLPAPSSSGGIEDMDPKLQQLLACSLGTSMRRTGLVMQETEQGRVALTAYSLQPQPSSRAPERSSVQLLASCIDKGDLSSLQSLRWEPPADPSPVPASEGAQKLPATESIIQVLPLDPDMGMGHQRGPSQAPGKAAPLAGEHAAPVPPQCTEGQKNRSTGRMGTATLGKIGSATTTPAGSGAPDLQAAMQSLRIATAKAQDLHQQVLNRHKQGSVPTATQDGLFAPTSATISTRATHSNTGPVTTCDPGIPTAPRKVSGEEEAPPRGLPRGWVTIQDSVYSARPMRTCEPARAVQPSETQAQPRVREIAPGAQSPSPLERGPAQSLKSQSEAPEGHTQGARGPPGTPSLRSLRATEDALKTAPLAHRTLASGPEVTGANLHSHNASVPPPPALPAAVTGPAFPARECLQEDSTQQDPLLHTHHSPAGQQAPRQVQTKEIPWKKPQVPPKPAYLTQMHPPRRLPKPSAPSRSSSSEPQQTHGRGEPMAAVLPATQAPATAGPGCSCRPSQSSPAHGLATMAPGPSQGQAVGSDAQSPEPPKLSVISSDPTPPQWGSSPPGRQLMDDAEQGTPKSPDILQGKQQELQGLLSEVQALEEAAVGSVDVRALRRLFEAVPKLPGTTPQAPVAPSSPEASVEQAFGELTRVSTEVARLKEQTLARLLDIEEAVRKVLSSMSSLQPDVNSRGHSQGPREDHNVHEVSVMASNGAGLSSSGGQIATKSQGQAGSHTELQNRREGKGQAAPATPPTRRSSLQTSGVHSGLPRVLPSSRKSPSSPTFISIQSASRKLPDTSNTKGSPDISEQSTHSSSQGMGQTLRCQKGVQDNARKEEVTQCFGQPEPAPASTSPQASRQQKSILELQTGLGGSQCYGATRTVTEQYEEVDQFGNTILASSTTVTEQAEPSRDPVPQLGCHVSPLLRPFLHSPARFSSSLAEADTIWLPHIPSQPAAQ